MGLYIEAISYGTLASAAEAALSEDEFELRDDLIEIEGYGFQRLDGKAPGLYRYDPAQGFGFEVGPYSTYKWWRDLLAAMVYGVEASIVWKQATQYAGQPFFELINFSDCQGAIGPQTSAKLLRDFLAHQEQAAQVEATGVEAVGFLTHYQNWITALQVAQQDGFIIFT